MKQITLLVIIALVIFTGCEKRILDKSGTSSTLQNNETPSQASPAAKQTKTIKPVVLEYIYAVVKAETGSMYVYLEDNANFTKLYPKMSESFNMWDLDYYLDLQTAGKLYKNVNIKTDRNDGGRSVGDLCHALKKGSALQIENQSWTNYVAGKVLYLLPNSIRIKY